MDFVLYTMERTVNFIVASIPLLIVLVQLKFFKLPPRIVVFSLIFSLVLSIYFWIMIKAIDLAIYQGIPYASSFIWVICENVLLKKAKIHGMVSAKSKDGSVSEKENTGDGSE